MSREASERPTRFHGARGLHAFVLALLGLLALPAALSAQQLDPREAAIEDEALRTAIGAYRADLEALRERLGVPGLSVAIAREGEILRAEGLGRADREAEREATAETPYRIASITRTMTAAVVVGLAREGALELDAPVSRELPEELEDAERELPASDPRVVTARHDFDGDGRTDTLAVVMTEGRRYRDTSAWCGAGEKFEGRFAVRGSLTSGAATRLPLEAFTVFRADDEALVLADYDHDGRMDFHLGQYASCNGWRYRLYSVDPDGDVRPLPVGASSDAWLPVGDFANSTREIVPTGRGFEACHYDNAATHTIRRYVWEREAERFVLASERRVDGGSPPTGDGAS